MSAPAPDNADERLMKTLELIAKNLGRIADSISEVADALGNVTIEDRRE